MAKWSIVAEALADAFLAGGWSVAGAEERAATALGDDVDRPWLKPLARRIVRAFPSPPDRALLALVIAADHAADAAARLDWVEGRPVVVRRPFVVPPRMVRRGAAGLWDVAELHGAGDLAAWLGVSDGDLSWLADPTGRLRRAAAGPLQHYALSWRAKASGGLRVIEAPKGRLKAVQRKVLRGILDRVPPHPAAYGFRRGRGVVEHAAVHAGKHAVLGLDLHEFFPSITRARVRAVFLRVGYPAEVARLLAGLCTTRVSAAEWMRLPGPRTAAEIAARRRAQAHYRSVHLPQGAPTSPALANLCAYRLDVRLASLAESLGIAYGRYADDLSFSAHSEAGARALRRMPALVERIAREEGFRVNAAKTRLMTRAGRQVVTGVVVNERPTVTRRTYDTLKAILHNCVVHGPESQNRAKHPDFRAHLAGRVAWVEQLDLRRGARLRARFDAIRW